MLPMIATEAVRTRTSLLGPSQPVARAGTISHSRAREPIHGATSKRRHQGGPSDRRALRAEAAF